MEYQTHYISPEIKLSEFEGKLFRTEVLFEHHILVWFISGETKIIQANTNYLFGPGDIFLIPRNQLATIINYPKDGQPHKAVAMHLPIPMLKTFYAKNPPKKKLIYTQSILNFQKHPLLESCFASLIPYFELKDTLPPNIAALKIEEAVNVLRAIDPEIDNILASFSEPGKINLVDFMEKNFMFNMPMEKFGYLTGRSLTTFKRDFKRSFDVTPQKWLTQKRLELAHYHLSTQKRKPSDIYAEVGFENLSHFSYAFKKHFGYTPGGQGNGES